MKKIVTLASSLFILSAVCASAQTFNPRVEVENTYEGKVVEAGKNPLGMTVPDSLYKFQYHLDYSVFDNPYQGSYNFRPYKIEMRPDAAPSDARRFYANLGAGWTFHPELDLIWSPVIKGSPMKLSVYDHLRGYLGDYGTMTYDEIFQIPAKPSRGTAGFVLDNKVGINTRYEFGKVALEVDAGYRAFASDDTLTSHFLQLAEAEIRLLPLDPNRADYFYGGRVYVNAGQDRFSSLMSGRHKLGVNDMGTDLRFGAPLSSRRRLLLDLGLQTIVYSGVLEAVATRVWATPRYQIRWIGGSAELGVNVSYLKGTDNSKEKPSSILFSKSVYQHPSSLFYPAILVRQYLVPDHLAVYAKVDGGDCLNGYSDYLRSNPFFDPSIVVSNLDASSERLNAAAGFAGAVAGKFQFDVHAGYAIRDNWRCDAVEFIEAVDSYSGDASRFLSSYSMFCDYKRLYADVSFLWKSPRVDLDGHFLYQQTDLVKNEYRAVEPARYSGEFQACYNWNRQAFVGVSVEAASAREGWAITWVPGVHSEHVWPVKVPGWVDLGVFGRYVVNPHWTLWAKGGNLLGQSVQHYFVHPEKGPYVTIGFSFNL